MASQGRGIKSSFGVRSILLALLGLTFAAALAAEPPVAINPAALPAMGTVDPRFLSYNVEMLEVTGGRFWKPYRSFAAEPAKKPDATPAAGSGPALSPDLYEYRPPINLSSPRLRRLAAALGPAYVRVSGTWANATYFPDKDGPAPATPPSGFNGVLTREQWKGVVDFARAVNAEIITSFAISPGTRNAQGVWTPDQARAFLAYTKSIGGKIAAAEFMNEPNLAALGAAPKGYDAAAYARDLALFRSFQKQTAPEILLLGPGSVAERRSQPVAASLGMLRSEDLLKAAGPAYDVFSYHLYPAISQRCAGQSPAMATSMAAALTDEWLARPDEIHGFYAGLRDQFEPGKPLWITETADAACGGNPWGSTFLDSFRYLDEHARLAQQGVRVVAHNTLAASDYGLLDENTFAPRPNYWAALLWRRLMGSTVLKPSPPARKGTHVYGHCLSGVPGGVALLAINPDQNAAQALSLPVASERFTLSAPKLDGSRVDLNGNELKLGANDALPPLLGVPTPAGQITLAPASITFLAVRDARNAACR